MIEWIVHWYLGNINIFQLAFDYKESVRDAPLQTFWLARMVQQDGVIAGLASVVKNKSMPPFFGNTCGRNGSCETILPPDGVISLGRILTKSYWQKCVYSIWKLNVIQNWHFSGWKSCRAMSSHDAFFPVFVVLSLIFLGEDAILYAQRNHYHR